MLLLGCFSTCYATSFSESELKNVWYNALTNFGDHDTTSVQSALDSFNFAPYSQYTKDYTYVYLIVPIYTNSLLSNTYYEFTIALTNDSTRKSQASYYYCNAYYTLRYKNGVISTGLGGVVNKYMQQNSYTTASYRFNDLNLYNANGNTVTLTNGWHPSNVDEGIYYDYRFNFSYPTILVRFNIIINCHIT